MYNKNPVDNLSSFSSSKKFIKLEWNLIQWPATSSGLSAIQAFSFYKIGRILYFYMKTKQEKN